MLEAVVNVSEGRRGAVVDSIARSAGPALLDVHTDPDHNRTVLTMAGPSVEAAVRRVAAEAVRSIDLGRHEGAHPRHGAVDVVPFVPLTGSTMADAIAARDRFVEWVGGRLGLPSVVYGPDGPSLPEVRRRLARGEVARHPTAGVCCAGARPVLVAYNLWLAEPDVDLARSVALQLRGPVVRALGLKVGSAVQVSCNLLDPVRFGPAAAFDAVATRAAVARAELVGLVPDAVLRATPPDRWPELDLGPSRTIEARLRAAGLDGGRFTGGGGGEPGGS